MAEEAEDVMVEARKKAIESVMKEFPLDMSAFTPDQTDEEGGSTGSVYIPSSEFRDYVKLTNISAKAFRLYYRAGFAHEIGQAKRERRRIDIGKIIDNGLFLNGQQNGWAAVRYNEVAAPLGPLRSAGRSSSAGWLDKRRIDKLRKKGLL